jgi:serine/threonine protein kinase
MALQAGSRLGPYEITAEIGAGGMGVVYRARDARLQRDVAIKVLSPEVAGDAERLQRFEQEARAAAALNHPNILAVYDLGQHPSTGSGQASPYIVSELLDFNPSIENLHHRISSTGIHRTSATITVIGRRACRRPSCTSSIHHSLVRKSTR